MKTRRLDIRGRREFETGDVEFRGEGRERCNKFGDVKETLSK